MYPGIFGRYPLFKCFITQCGKLKWTWITQLGILGFKEIKFLKMVIKFDFLNKIPLWWCFLKNMMTTYQYDVSLNNFKFQKMKMVNINYLHSKSSDKHILCNFSYVVISYQVWNIHNTLNVLFTLCATTILLFFD
jgi:hypothetical protein